MRNHLLTDQEVKDDNNGTFGDAESNDNLSEPKSDFDKRSPLLNVLYLSIGPLLFNVGISFNDAIDLMLVAHVSDETKQPKLCKYGIEVIGFASLIRFLCVCCTIYFVQSIVAKVAAFLGNGEDEKAAQVLTDLYRISFLSLAAVSCIFYFVCEKMIIFMGGSGEVPYLCKVYLRPILIAMPFISMFQLSCGFIQSQGKSVINGCIQISAKVLCCFILQPLILYAFKKDIAYAGLSFALAQTIPGIILSTYIFMGKMNVKPEFRMMYSPVSKDTLHALLLGAPYILNIIATTIPPMIMLKMMLKAGSVSDYDVDMIASAFTVFLKLNSAVNSFSIGINQGLITAGSYFRGAKNWPKLIKSYFCAIACTLTYHVCWIPVMLLETKPVAEMWLEPNANQKVLNAAVAMIKIAYCSNFLVPVDGGTIAFLIASGKPVFGLVSSVARAIAILSSTFAFYKSFENNTGQRPIKMMHTYNVSDVVACIVSLSLLAITIPKVRRDLTGSNELSLRTNNI